MTLLFFCPRWGSESLGIADFCAKAKAAGYDGVELALPFGDQGGTEAILAAIHDNSLEFIGQHWATSQRDIEAHAEEFRRQLEWLADAKPLFINSQTGKDWFPAGWSERLIAIAGEVSKRRGLRIVHETHRGKFAYSAAVTRGFLERDPELRLSVDLALVCRLGVPSRRPGGEPCAGHQPRRAHPRQGRLRGGPPGSRSPRARSCARPRSPPRMVGPDSGAPSRAGKRSPHNYP